jgi:PEP-CTERM motif
LNLTQWSFYLNLATIDLESLIDLSVDIPGNSLDINGFVETPEPGSLSLVMLGGLAYLVRRKRQKA